MTTHYSVEFCEKIIETTVTNKASVAEHCIENIIPALHQNGETRIVGLSCKFKHHPIQSMSNKIAILQLCINTKCLILQIIHIDYIPQSIKAFLSDSHITFVGIEIHENSEKISKEYELSLSRKVDVHFLAKRWFPISYRRRPSLKAIAFGVAGLYMRMKSSKFNIDWESRVLDEELVKQACIDAYASYAIAHRLLTVDNGLA